MEIGWRLDGDWMEIGWRLDGALEVLIIGLILNSGFRKRLPARIRYQIKENRLKPYGLFERTQRGKISKKKKRKKKKKKKEKKEKKDKKN